MLASRTSRATIEQIKLIMTLEPCLYCPETVPFEAGEAHLWASEFTTIPRAQRIGILGTEGFWAGLTYPVTRLIKNCQLREQKGSSDYRVNEYMGTNRTKLEFSLYKAKQDMVRESHQSKGAPERCSRTKAGQKETKPGMLKSATRLER
jgi:hypothetical protein